MSGDSPAPPQLSLGQLHARTVTLGMWVFLATELMFFGPLFLGYAYGRLHFPASFAAAARQTEVLPGTLNTALLLTSSFLMANAIEALELHRARLARALLFCVAFLGIAFLIVKGWEYRHEWQERLFPGRDSALGGEGQFFFLLYFAMTGLHAVHLAAGIAIVLVFACALRRDTSALAEPRRLTALGLYWHFVDAVWIFLYPILYLVGRSA